MQVLELLHARAATLEARKSTIMSDDYKARIEEEVAKYRAELTERYQAERNSKLEGIDIEINALHNWIAEETAKAVPETVSVPSEPTEPVQPKVTPMPTIPAAFQRFKNILTQEQMVGLQESLHSIVLRCPYLGIMRGCTRRAHCFWTLLDSDKSLVSLLSCGYHTRWQDTYQTIYQDTNFQERRR